MDLLFFEHCEEEMKFVAKMRGSVGFAASFEAKGGGDFLLDSEKVMDVRRKSLPIILFIKFATVHPGHVLEPTIVMFLMEIPGQVFAQFPFDIDEPIVEDGVLQVLGSLVTQKTVDFKEVSHIVLMRGPSELEDPYLGGRNSTKTFSGEIRRILTFKISYMQPISPSGTACAISIHHPIFIMKICELRKTRSPVNPARSS
jgi:hypothetical protein